MWPNGAKCPEKTVTHTTKDKDAEMKKALKRERRQRKKALSLDLKLDRWFLTRFSIQNPYGALRQEFEAMNEELVVNPWTDIGKKKNPYVTTPSGGGATRSLKINAQRILCPHGGPGYIACEGPTHLSVYDFWMLIYQEKVERVLSVNFPYEERLYPGEYQQERETVQYWPTTPGVTMMYMPFKVTCLSSILKYAPNEISTENSDTVYRVSRLMLTYCNPITGPTSDSVREVIHVCFYRWPDGRLPIPWPAEKDSLTKAGMKLVDIVKEELLAHSQRPLVVHCHAGLGRTGVVIAVEMALKQYQAVGTVNIKGVVERLREYRPRSVMNHWQYAYIHLVVAEKMLQNGTLSAQLGGHDARTLIDELWVRIEKEVETVFENQGAPRTYDPETCTEKTTTVTTTETIAIS